MKQIKCKKVLSIILSFAMLFSITVGLDISASATTKSGRCGENLFYTFDDLTGDLLITGSGDMYDYYTGDSPFGFLTIKNIYMDEGITRIGNTAFLRCYDLVNITFPDSLNIIGKNAFSFCNKLENINLNNIKEIEGGAFSGSGIKSIIVPNSINKISSGVFSGCTNLIDVKLPDGLSSIGEGSFSACFSLVELIIPDSVERIEEEAFNGCTELKSIKIPRNISYIGKTAFDGCTSLEEIVLPKDITNINTYTFEYCENLSQITIFNNVEIINKYAFYKCENLKTVYYCGTEEQWNKIYIDNGNDCLKNASIIYHIKCEFTKKETVVPTCKKDGYILYECDICKSSYKEILPACHLFRINNYQDYNIEYTCIDCHSKEIKSCKDVFEKWNSSLINSKVIRGNDTGYLDVVDDGIINAKDYAMLLRLAR